MSIAYHIKKNSIVRFFQNRAIIFGMKKRPV